MSWLKLDDQYPEHPKLASLTPSAFRAHVRCMAYCARHLTDGFIPAVIAQEYAGDVLAELTKKQRIGEPLLVPCDDGYEVHDYLEYNPTREKVMAERKRVADRVNRHRNASSNGDCNGVTTDVSNPGCTDAPYPYPSLDPKPVSEDKGTRAMHATLPACLDIPSTYTDFPDMTLAQAVLRHADATFGWNGGCAPDRSGLIAVFESGCFEGCKHSKAQAKDCADTAIKAIDRCAAKGATKWQRGGRGLFAAVMNDRDRVEVAS